MAKHRKTRKHQKGRGYGFGGSILDSASGSNAGNAMWQSTAGSDCGMSKAELSRGGNNVTGGRRRKHRRRGSKRHTRKGGSRLALQQPRAGYTFDGSGVAGTADPVPAPSYTTSV